MVKNGDRSVLVGTLLEYLLLACVLVYLMYRAASNYRSIRR